MDQPHRRGGGGSGVSGRGVSGRNESEYGSKYNSSHSSNNLNDKRSLKKKSRLSVINDSNKNSNNKKKSNLNYQPRNRSTWNTSKTNSAISKELCQKIRNCKTLMEVLQLLRRESGSLKPSHLSFYWNQIARLISINTSSKSSSMNSLSCLQRLKCSPALLKPLVGLTIRHNSALNPRSLAVTAHAIAKISNKTRKSVVDSDKLWELLAKNIIQKATAPRENFSVQECANIVWSFAKEFGGRHQQGKTSSSNGNATLLFDAMLKELTPKLNLCNAQDIANTVWAYATAVHPAPALFDAMIPIVMEKLDNFDSQNLANTVWAYATVQHPAPQLFDAVATAALAATTNANATTRSATNSSSGNKLDTFNSQAIANTVWAYASMGHYTPNSKLFLDALSTSAIKKLNFFNSQEMAITLWGCATLNHSSSKFFDAVSHHAIQKLPTFNPQEIANTVWAYAHMGHQASELFYAISQLVIERINSLSSQAMLANTATHSRGGYHVGNSHPEFLNVASPPLPMTSSTKMDTFNSQTIANTVWAYATVGHTDPHLFNAMSQLALLKLDSFNSQEIANTMWAYATANHPAPEFFNAVTKLAISKLDTFNSQEIANTLWAFATLSHPAPEFFDAVSNLTVTKLNTFNSQELANAIWAYAAVYHYSVNPQFTNGILWETIQKLESLDSEQIVNILWSLVVLDCINTQSVIPLFSEISKRYYSSQNGFQLSREAMSQLHQASMWYSEEHSCNKSLLPVQLRQECFTNFCSNENTSSKLQYDIVQAFRSLPPYLGVFVIEEESRCQRTGYSIDVLIGVQQQKVAVEIDGPCHFIGFSPNGATMLKQRQLCSLGTTPLLSIPYWEWDMLSSNSDNNTNNIMMNNMWNGTSNYDPYHHYNNELRLKQSYLQQRLQQASFL